MSSEYVIVAAEDNFDLPEMPLGQLFLNVLLSRDKDETIMIHGVSGKAVTNGDLIINTLQLVAALKREGLQKGDVIAVVSENNLWYPVPLLAGCYMGVITSFLSPTYTYGELCHTLNISKPRVIFCSKSAVELIKNVTTSLDFVEKVIVFDNGNFEDIESISNFMKGIPVHIDAFDPEVINVETDGCFILCTSGSTGMPKGALITHKNMRCFKNLLNPKFCNLTSAEVTLIVLPMFHVMGLGWLLAALYRGCKIIIMEKFQPQLFLQLIEKYQVAILSLVPTIVHFLAKSDLIFNYNLNSVTTILCGGSPLHKTTEEAVKRRLNIQHFIQGYGCTELTGAATIQPQSNQLSNCCGQLVPGNVGKICCPISGKSLPRGEIGEIRIKGPGRMKYYFQNLKETEECLDEDGFYKTGDIGYFDNDGNLFVVDRIKEIIKYKGFQVAPAEIESILLSHPSIKEAAVVGIPDERVGELPTAFVVLDKQKDSLTEKEIWDLVAERLSVYKRLHGGVVFIDELPKTQSGKIMRKTLRDRVNDIDNVSKLQE